MDAGAVVGGRYRVVRPLGKGGMAAVFEVEDTADGRRLALKLQDDSEQSRRRELRFQREFHTMANLRHPRVVEVFDYGVADTGAFYTMELLGGDDLRDAAELSLDQRCRILRDVATALAFIHSKRLIHRDISPRNVRRTADGRAKLIDFGVLASPGVSADIAGTPPFIAPESVNGMQIDHRADLFSLGALAYWLFTGRQAYPARAVEDLELLWQRKVPLPSAIDDSVTQQLDELVMSLLSLEALERPGSAAEIIDRLDAVIGESAPDDEIVARGYLASASFVGRRDEMRRLRRYLERAVGGVGRAVSIQAPSGMGKTRILRELAIEAQIRGFTTVSVTAENEALGPYGVVAAIIEEIIAAAPGEAIETLRPHAPVLVRILPKLRAQLGNVEPAPSYPDPAAERMRAQAVLESWLVDVCSRHALAILVDDVQRCDEASAAVLAALAHNATSARVVIATALRTDETARAIAPLAALRDASREIRLTGLAPDDVGELVNTTFGQVEHAAKTAHHMHEVSRGSPLHCVELIRFLIEQGAARYVDGVWALPADIMNIGLPQRLADAMDAQIASLEPAPRDLAEALAIHGRHIGLDRCVLLARATADDDASVYDAVDELIYRDILLTDGETYRFRHDGLREALLRPLSEERTKQLHLRVGHALQTSPQMDAAAHAKVGWHLVEGGQEDRGARHLEVAGAHLHAAQAFEESVPALETALRVRERQGAPAAITLPIKVMLVMGGLLSDHQVVTRYCGDTVDELHTLSGVGAAQKIGRFLGRKLGLIAGIGWAFVRWLFAPRKRLNPIGALRSLFITINAAAAAYALSMDFVSLRRLIPMLEPFRAFKSRVPYAAYLFTHNVAGMASARFDEVYANCETVLSILEKDRLSPMSDMERITLQAATRYMKVLIAVSRQDPSYEREVDELAELDLRYLDLAVLQAHLAYHRSRGEEDKAADFAAKIEVVLIQQGSAWQLQAWLAVVSALAYGFARDVMGLKKSIAALDRFTRDGLQFGPILDLSRGEYHRERGELEQANTCLTRSLLDLPPEANLIRQPALAALAETLLALGQLDRARDVATQAVTEASDPDTGMIANRLRSVAALSLIEGALGNHDSANDMLETAISEAAPLHSPSLCGGLHETRARLAVMQENEEEFRYHLRKATAYFEPSRNPALMSRVKRLSLAMARARAERVEPAGTAFESVTAVETPEARRNRVSSILTGCRGTSERATRALEILLEQSSGLAGYLYVLDGGKPTLVAQTEATPPPESVNKQITRVLASGSVEPVTVADTPQSRNPAWRVVLLHYNVGGSEIAVGAAAIHEGPIPWRTPSDDLIAQISAGLELDYDRTGTSTRVLKPEIP